MRLRVLVAVLAAGACSVCMRWYFARGYNLASIPVFLVLVKDTSYLLRSVNPAVLKVTRKLVRRFLWGCLLLFIALNVVALLHAYRFTHFASNAVEKTQSA